MISVDQNLEQTFQTAVGYVSKATASTFASDDKLTFYSYFKQASVGTCNTPKPGFFDFVGKAKWEAWNALGAMSKHESMTQYIQYLTRLVPNWSSNPNSNNNNNESDEKQIGKSNNDSLGGPLFSRMLDDNEDIPVQDRDLLYFAQQGDLKAVEEQLKQLSQVSSLKSEINRKGIEGIAALHFAADRGSNAIVTLLLLNGADINLQDDDGQTAAHYASLVGNSEVLSTLIQSGIDTSIRDNDENTALDVAADEKVKQILQHCNPQSNSLTT